MKRSAPTYFLVPLSIFLVFLFRCTEFPSKPEPIIKEVIITETEVNAPPVAIIEILDTRVEFTPGDTVRLSGSKSFDPDSSSEQLLFTWRALNGGRLSAPTEPNPFFVSDSSGKFYLSLTVFDSISYSLPVVDSLIYVPIPQKPVAVIVVSPNDTTLVGKQVILDGSRSTDPNDDELTYLWTSHDGGAIDDTTAQITHFSSPIAGTFVISLRVSDGVHQSARVFQNIVVLKTIEPNLPPVVIVTASDTLVDPDTWVMLDASESYDPEGGRIRFHWQTLNGGELESESGAMTRFRAKAPNIYVIAVEVFDSLEASERGFVNVRVRGAPPDTTPPNLRPIADAGQDHITVKNQAVLLDGSASFDLNNDDLSYEWQAIDDGGTLATPLAKTTLFTPTAKGMFRFSLTVSDDSLKSMPDTVRVFVQNRPPTAIASNDTTINLGGNATLDASRSFDPDGDQLSYTWEGLDGGEIANNRAKTTAFSATQAGDYDISLVVNDGEADSKRDFVRIRVFDANRQPVAIAGNDTTFDLGGFAILDASQSFDLDNDVLTYTWTALNDGTIPAPDQKTTTFEPPAPGNFVISLVVHDGKVFSKPDYKQVTVLDKGIRNKPPVAIVGPDTTYFFNQQVQLDGSRSFDPEDSTLTYNWIEVDTNPEKFDLPNIAKPVFTPVNPGVYIFILYVSDGELFSKPAQIKIEIIAPDFTVKPGESIDAAVQAAAPGNLIFVQKGLYVENIRIENKDSLTILSTDVTGTTVDGNGLASTFRVINSKGVTIRGFTIKGGGTIDKPYDIDVAGISCQTSPGTRIIDNRLEKNRGDGIRIYFSNNVKVEKNELIENEFNGIRSTASSFDVFDNIFKNNGPGKKGPAGISIESRIDTVVDVSSLVVQIRGNTFDNNAEFHIRMGNEQIVIVDDNLFTGANGIITNENAGVILTISNNTFRTVTATPVYCQTKTMLMMENNFIENANMASDRIGVDLINTTGSITGNTIKNFTTGLNILTSDVSVDQNKFINNETAIRAIGPPCPTIGDANTFESNSKDFDFTGCTPPANFIFWRKR